jgi:hypothetical protein
LAPAAACGSGRVYAFDEGIAPLSNAVLEPGDPTQTCTDGYFLGEQDGDVHTFGSAIAAAGAAPTADVIDIQSSVTGCGYWRVFAHGAGDPAEDAPDLGVLTLGDAAPSTDGGVSNFSDRAFLGSLGAAPPDAPVVAISTVL